MRKKTCWRRARWSREAQRRRVSDDGTALTRVVEWNTFGREEESHAEKRRRWLLRVGPNLGRPWPLGSAIVYVAFFSCVPLVFEMDCAPTSAAEDLDGPEESNGALVLTDFNLPELLDSSLDVAIDAVEAENTRTWQRNSQHRSLSIPAEVSSVASSIDSAKTSTSGKPWMVDNASDETLVLCEGLGDWKWWCAMSD
ncbi:hypothetical protein PIB30_048306 [Stylosanthes scabra]|uniref:Uncharacterized protein n=1 Tax=Stylosanthes scabra TaxID=79078 RepID=A0ABU6WHE6_9FABA|nr:hypothetical protein [Stylosanthes scabra]